MDPETRRLFESAQQVWRQVLRTRATDEPATALGWVTFYLLEDRQPSPGLIKTIQRQLASLARLGHPVPN